MRDVISQTKTISSTYKKTTWTFDVPLSHNHFYTKTYRDDIVYGTRRGDGFRYPTAYRAFFSNVINDSFEVYAGTSLLSTSTYKFWGRSSTGASARNWTTFGCTNVTYPVPVPSTWLKGKVTNNALAGLKNGDFNLGIALAEMHKTVAFVIQSIALFREAWIALHRRDIVRMRKLLRRPKLAIVKSKSQKAADLWLSYQYAFKPLMNDIYGAIDALNRGWDQYPPILSSRAASTESVDPLFSLTESYKGNTFSGDATRGVEIKLFYSVSNTWIHGLNSVGLLNPGLIAWELVPFSFVFDWFIPVGNWLEACLAPMGLQFVTGYRTHWIKSDFTIQYVPNSWYFYHGVRPKLRVTTRGMQRIPLFSFPAAAIYIDPFQSKTQLVSGIALSIATLNSMAVATYR